jgi:alpha,alpha-trehalose phosphorylase
VRETQLQLDTLAQTESLFALANGHFGLRGNLDEGEPFGLPGTYLGGFHEIRPLPYPEGGYGYPEAGQAVVNVTNGKIIRLLVEDEPFDVRYGELRRHERSLDLRAGVLRRSVEWVSPTGRLVQIRSTRLVSFSQRAVAAILYEVEPLDGEAPVVLQSDLVANERLPPSEAEPRAAAALASPLTSELFLARDMRALLAHSTRASGLAMVTAMAHEIDGPPDTGVSAEAFEDLARVEVTATVEPGRPLRIVKFLTYGWSSQRSLPAIRDQVAAALGEARHTGWEKLVAQQRAYLNDFWGRADVEIEGDPGLQQAVRFALFHILQAGARAARRPIAAKALTGPG